MVALTKWSVNTNHEDANISSNHNNLILLKFFTDIDDH